MFTVHRLLGAMTIALLLPAFAAAQDRDAREVQGHVLTDAGLAKYTQATKKIAALPGGDCDDDDSQSIDQMTAKLNASPGARAAIQSAGMTTREYVVFTWSLLQTGLAAWAVDQPGGKLPQSPSTNVSTSPSESQSRSSPASLLPLASMPCDTFRASLLPSEAARR
jgi:hypothetical protein